MDYSIYEQECNRINKTVVIFKEVYRSLYEASASKVVRKEIGMGGVLMHRGYYCPSLITDIVVGNVKRERIVKQIPTNSKEYFVYGFDKDNNLLTVNRGFCDEVIIREGDKETGIIFTQYGVEAISESIYKNNRLESYGYYQYIEEKGIIEFQKETYTYSQSELIVDYISYSNMLTPILEHTRYEFEVEGGYLVSYRVKEERIDNDLSGLIPRNPLIVNSTDTDRMYTVRVKRKVI